MFCKRAHLPDFSLLIFFQVGAQNPWFEWANYPLQLDQFTNLAARQGAHASQRGKQGNACLSKPLLKPIWKISCPAQHQVSQTLPLCRNGQCKFCVFFGGGGENLLLCCYSSKLSVRLFRWLERHITWHRLAVTVTGNKDNMTSSDVVVSQIFSKSTENCCFDASSPGNSFS